MKKLCRTIIIVSSLAVFTACQAVFTFSPVATLQRDTATLSSPQKIELAKDVLVAGTADELAEAYTNVTAIIAAGDTTPETNLLAAELAFASSGITDVISNVLEDPDLIASATEEELTTLFESLDADLITAGATFVQTASEDEDAQITSTQYVIAGAALLASAAEEAGGFSILDTPPESGDPGFEEYQDATEFLDAAGIDELADLFSF